MLEERSEIDQITILSNGQIQVRRADKILRDGDEIAKTYHRHVVVPGASLVNEDSRVQLVATAIHTPTVVAAWTAMQRALQEA